MEPGERDVQDLAPIRRRDRVGAAELMGILGPVPDGEAEPSALAVICASAHCKREEFRRFRETNDRV